VQSAALDLMGQGLISAAHDCSDGGLAVAVAEMAIAGGCGVKLALVFTGGERRDAALFGEAPSRILLAISPEKAQRLNSVSLPESVHLTELGIFEGDLIQLGDAGTPLPLAAQVFDSALRSESGDD
jgi:phosphoribosylformylglycinamidine synthase